MRVRMLRVVIAWFGLTVALLSAPMAAQADDSTGVDFDLARRVAELAKAVPPAGGAVAAVQQAGDDADKAARVELDQAAQAAALDHWTPDNMRSALDGDLLLAGHTLDSAADNVDQGVATLVPGVPLPEIGGLDLGGLAGLGGLLGGGGTGGSTYSNGGAVVATSGKVFFTLDGTDYVCSGSSTAAANRSLVQTAGHCVNEGPGAFATNFVFVPAYRDGQTPYGTFAARALQTTGQWSGSGDLSYDVGYAIVSPVGGRALADTVGAQGIGFNLARGAQMYAFGYPAEAPYDGSKLAWCSGVVSADGQGTSDQGMKCNMTGGSSGGPWFLNFNESTGIGTLNSLNSFRYTTFGLLDSGSMYGPYFGSVIQSLYSSASQ
ncbi:MAG: trypsin-like serine peptidase [Aeromicrobium sp.]